MTAQESLCIVPISGMVSYLSGPPAVGMDAVRFLSWQRLQERWAELGFTLDPIEDLRSKGYQIRLDSRDVVALLGSRELPNLAVEEAPKKVLHALQLLLSCNPAWGPGGLTNRPVVGLEPGRVFGFTYAQAADARTSLKATAFGSFHEVRLDGFWEGNKDAGFFDELNSLIEDRSILAPEWAARLLESAMLLGQSRLATSPWEAFLLAMVGIERLLKSKQDQNWHKGVGANVKSLFSWLSSGKGNWYVHEIRNLYSLRNRVVHEGAISGVQGRSVKIADEVLFNLLLVSFKHLGEVKSLDQLIERGRQVEVAVQRGEKPTALPNAVAIHASEY